MPMLQGMATDPDAMPDSDQRDTDRRLLADRLVGESACELQADTGEWIEVWLISARGATVIGSAPRLAVRAGMRLEWRTQLQGQPVVATLIIDEATYRS